MLKQPHFPEELLPHTKDFSGGGLFNRLKLMWDDPVIFGKFMNDIMINNERYNIVTRKEAYRDGFPPEVALELFKLDRYYRDHIEPSSESPDEKFG